MINIFFKKDQSKKEIRDIERFFEYKKTKPIKYDQEFWQLKEELTRNPNVQVNKAMNYSPTSISKVQESYCFWKSLNFNMQKISILNTNSFLSNGESILLIGNLLDYISEDTPDRLPLSYKEENQPEGGVISCNLENKRNGIKCTAFQKIILPSFGNLVTSCVYAHEITHTQMIVNYGGGVDFLNSETIPILMELLAAYYNDPNGETLKHVYYFRLANINYYLDKRTKKGLDYQKKVVCDTYIKSIIQAIKLASIYFSSSEQIRKEMLEYINNLFNGNRNLDEMLSFYGINFRDCNLKSLELKRIGS